VKDYFQKAIGRKPSAPGEARAVATEALTITAIGVTLGLGASAYGASSGLRLGLQIRNSPVLYTLSQTGTSTAVRTTAASALRIKSAYNKAKVVAWFANPFQTVNYLMDRDFTRAGISYYGPLGAVYAYNYLQQQKTGAGQDISPSEPVRSKKKKTTAKQKRRWKRKKGDMHIKGMPWCDKHKRYHYC